MECKMGPFSLDQHVKTFEKYDSWDQSTYMEFNARRQAGDNEDADGPVAYFSVEEEWDDVEVNLDRIPVGQYILVKFLEPRHNSAERLGIIGIRFYGFNRKAIFVQDARDTPVAIEKGSDVLSSVVITHVLGFLVSLSQDLGTSKPGGSGTSPSKPQHLDMADINLALVWKLYSSFFNNVCHRSLCLQLLHTLFPFLVSKKQQEKETYEPFFEHLCRIVDEAKIERPVSASDIKLDYSKESEFDTENYAIKLEPCNKNEQQQPKNEQQQQQQQQGNEEEVKVEEAKEEPKTNVKNNQNVKKNQELVVPLKKPEIVGEEERLIRVAREVIIDGAAVFFPDKEARRKQLFNMMGDVNGSSQVVSPSVSLTFQSLCQFFSNIDPSGLLDLPSKVTQDFAPAPVLAVMETLMSVTWRECRRIIDGSKGSTDADAADECAANEDQCSHLLALVCSLQTSLLVWCHNRLQQPATVEGKIVEEQLIVKYVEMLSEKSSKALSLLAQAPKDQQIVSLIEKLELSFLATVVPQFVLILTQHAGKLSSACRVKVAQHLMSVAKEMKKLSGLVPECFYKYDSGKWQQINAGEVVLRTWEVESTHNYENNLHVTQLFSCPGASTFIVEFDPRCETEKRYDYLEFTDSRGIKTRYDQKVGSEKWPNLVVFRGGHKLQFLFNSDSSNNYWGYKFKVKAKGSPDMPLGWIFDLHLSLAKLFGRLCGTTLDVTTVLPKATPTPENMENPELEMLKSELWTTLLRGGYMVGKLQRSFSGKHVAMDDSQTAGFLWNMVEDEEGLAVDMLKKLQEGCSTCSLGGAEVTAAVTAVFAALLWHTQTLRDDIQKYVRVEGECKISDGITQAYHTAEGLRTLLIDQRQKDKLNAEEKNKSKMEIDPIIACKEKALFLLKFSGLSKVNLKSESKPKLDRRTSKIHNRLYKLDAGSEKHPAFKLVLDFVRDPTWDKSRVEQLLRQRSQQAQAVAEVYMFIAEFLRVMAEDHIFKVPNVVFLQELLRYQDRFARRYGDGLDGCGLELETQVRRAYYMLVRRLVDSVRNVNRATLPKNVVPCFDYIQACMLHLLDMDWQLYDLAFLVDINLPQLYMDLAKGSVSMREQVTSAEDPAVELRNYKRNQEWLKECMKGFYDWYDKMTRGDMNKERKKDLQMFIACYCDLLDVEINCDGCGVTLPGSRYRCLKCHDMDLCATCYAGGVKPGGEHTDEHEIVHLTFKCDQCQAFIVGSRVHCDICEDFDLCLGCHESQHFPHGHTTDHSVTKVPITKWRLNKEADSSLLSYIHQHVWLQFSSLALSMAHLLYHPNRCDPDLDYVKSASLLYNSCIELVTKCLMSVGTSVSVDEVVEGVGVVKSGEEGSSEHRQEEAFAIHSQERIMGLLGAMIPPENKTPLAEDVSTVFTSEEFFTMLFSIARGETEHETNTEHLALALIGQLLQRTTTTCQVVDSAIANTKDPDETAEDTSDAESLPASAAEATVTTPESIVVTAPDGTLLPTPEGTVTARFLFEFGATCLERSGLDWANSMAGILHALFNSPAWRDVLREHVMACMRNLDGSSNGGVGEGGGGGDKPQLSTIFALFVIAGFPEVLSIGSHVKYTELGTEVKNGVVLKHFPDKNQTLLVDKKSRKRRTLKDEVVECARVQVQVLDQLQIDTFLSVILNLGQSIDAADVNNGSSISNSVSVESMWVLSLALKALLRSLGSGTQLHCDALYSQDFVRCIVKMACKGTGFSRHWLLKDLEILSLMLYTGDKDETNSTITNKDGGASGKVVTKEHRANAEKGATSESPEVEIVAGEDPLEGLDDTAKLCFTTIHQHLSVPLTVLRVIYDMHGQNTDALLMAVHDNIEDYSYNAPENVMKLAEKWGGKVSGSSAGMTDDGVDSGMHMLDTTQHSTAMASNGDSEEYMVALEEPSDVAQNLISSETDNDQRSETTKQRKSKSAALLKKELEAQGKVAARSFLIKVNLAMSVMYARHVLRVLLADWPAEGPSITAELLGCNEDRHIPLVLNLLNRPECKDSFQKVVQNLIKHCLPSSLIPIALTSCQFMEEVNMSTVVKESQHNYKSNEDIQEKIHIAGATMLHVAFDNRCCTEDSCDELILSSSSDYKQDRHVFCGPYESGKWADFDMPGDTIFMRFKSDCSNNDWGYRFKVTGGRMGRFDTGYRILNGILSAQQTVSFPCLSMWRSLVLVACKQTGEQRLKALQLLLKIMHTQFKHKGCKSLEADLGLLCPLWALYNKTGEVTKEGGIVPAVIRALTELFLVAEDLALDWDCTAEYLARLQSKEDIHRTVYQGLMNIAAISLVIGVTNKATEGFKTLEESAKSAAASSAKSAKTDLDAIVVESSHDLEL